MAGRLFVIFRGNWAHLHSSAMEIAKTPDMGREHVYQAGNLDDMKDIRFGSLIRLVGVDQDHTPGKGVVDGRLQPVIRKTILGAPDDCTSVTTLAMPPAIKVYSLHRLIIPGQEFQIKGTHTVSQYGNPEIIASLMDIYEYTYEDVSMLALHGLRGWVPHPVDDVATLHFHAEPKQAPPPGHTAKEFQYASQLLDDDFQVNDPDQYSYWNLGDYPREFQKRLEELQVPGYGPGTMPEVLGVNCLPGHGCGGC